MNCKKGDLAVIVKSIHGQEGIIVRCLEYYDGPWVDRETGSPGWFVDRELINGRYVFDDRLRPIRDNDGEDETLTWAGKPAKEIT